MAALIRHTGSERAAKWLHARLRGIDDSPVEPRGAARSISRDETFARDLHDDAELEHELWRLLSRAAADMRREGLRARTITVRLRDADFTNRQASQTLGGPVETERAMQPVARALLHRLRRARRVPARLLGVALSGFAGEDSHQLNLFDEDSLPPLESPRDRALVRATDAIRARFGSTALR